MAMDKEKREEVCKILLSLLLARQGPTPIPVLDNDYYEAEGERIPWRKFGHTDLIDFLKSAPHQFSVQLYNGVHRVYGIASDKSRHVSSLVARQKPKILPPRVPRTYRPVMMRYIPQQRPCKKIPPDHLHYLVKYIRKYPDGVSMHKIREFVDYELPFMKISVQDLRTQLYDLSHQLRIDGEIIYPVQIDSASRNVNYKQSPSLIPPQVQNSSYSASVKVCPGGDEESDYMDDLAENNFVPAGCISNNHSKSSRVHERRVAANFTQNTQFSEQNSQLYYNKNDNINDDVYLTTENYSINMTETIKDNEQMDISELINQKTKLRLKQLIEKHPDGICCADLPDLFLKEYNVHLNYIDLGFTSVREYVSYLTDIFYMIQKSENDDFLLFSIDKKPMIEKACKPNSTEGEASSRERRDDCYGVRAEIDDDNDDSPIPANIVSNINNIV